MNAMTYHSTRGSDSNASFTDILLAGLARDGGLYVPQSMPSLDINKRIGKDYQSIAQDVLTPFVQDTLKADDLSKLIVKAYGSFNHPSIAPVVEHASGFYVMELFHGPTLAFKDYALQFLGALFDHVLKARGKKITIVGATSGDTGSAAIAGCVGSKHIDIFILHPKGRTSEVQRRQMTTVQAENVFNIAVEGTFDDCQALVKAMFADRTFRDDLSLSAINSINFARIAAQIVYYAAACAGFKGAPVSFAVPTGNFGNVYAAYCAKKMGLPIETLIIGSNRNDILTRFFETGLMKTGAVQPSISPSMDIQVSSNFERYLYDLLVQDPHAVKTKMDALRLNGEFDVTPDQHKAACKEFTAQRCSDDETLRTMAQYYKETGYLLDPHTAVGVHAAKMVKRDPSVPVVALACAHPAKFPDAVEKATGIRPSLPQSLADLYDRVENYATLPADLKTLQSHIRKHTTP
jgi:threonine synthase